MYKDPTAILTLRLAPRLGWGRAGEQIWGKKWGICEKATEAFWRRLGMVNSSELRKKWAPSRAALLACVLFLWVAALARIGAFYRSKQFSLWRPSLLSRVRSRTHNLLVWRNGNVVELLITKLVRLFSAITTRKREWVHQSITRQGGIFLGSQLLFLTPHSSSLYEPDKLSLSTLLRHLIQTQAPRLEYSVCFEPLTA